MLCICIGIQSHITDIDIFNVTLDEIIDYDWTPVRNYIEDKSWQSLMASGKPNRELTSLSAVLVFIYNCVVEEKVNQWMCTRCKLATTALNMVECEQCSCWYHW